MVESPSRRKFYTSFISGLGGLIAAIVGVPALAYVFGKPKAEQGGGWVEIADIGDLPVGKPQEIVYRRTRVDGWKRINEKTTAWVVRTDATNVIAFSPACTHLGCAYSWDDSEGNFRCPCHTSAFSVQGEVLAGPAARPLDRYKVKLEGGKLLVGLDVIRPA
jgi:menaquinol-cytochrome c reductase iron-sulfur subunit